MSLPALGYRLDGPLGAPLLVLSGSLGTTMDLWDAQVAALATEFRILRFDHPGHGRTPVWPGPVTVPAIGQALLGLLAELDADSVSWCGLSLGGAVGQWLAAHAAPTIDALILCCTAARFNAPEAYRQRAARARREGMRAVSPAVVERWFTPGFQRLQTEVVARFRAALERLAPEGYAQCCEAVAEFDSRSYLAAIRAPALVMAGEQDQATPVELVRVLRDTIQDARWHVVPGAAHLANVEQPAAVTIAIREHLATAGGRKIND